MSIQNDEKRVKLPHENLDLESRPASKTRRKETHDVVNKDVVNKDAVNKDVVNKDVVNKDVVNNEEDNCDVREEMVDVEENDSVQ
jgi:putative NADH-flavin reductase